MRKSNSRLWLMTLGFSTTEGKEEWCGWRVLIGVLWLAGVCVVTDGRLSAGYKKMLEEPKNEWMNEQEFTVTSDFRLPSGIEHLFKRHRLHPSHWGSKATAVSRYPGCHSYIHSFKRKISGGSCAANPGWIWWCLFLPSRQIAFSEIHWY